MKSQSCPFIFALITLQFKKGTALHVLEISDVSLLAGCVVKLTHLTLLPEIEGVASRLRPARLTTPNDSLGCQVLDVMVEQTLRCEATPIVSRQAVHRMRDAHLASNKFVKTTLIVSPLAIVFLTHFDTVFPSIKNLVVSPVCIVGYKATSTETFYLCVVVIIFTPNP